MTSSFHSNSPSLLYNVLVVLESQDATRIPLRREFYECAPTPILYGMLKDLHAVMIGSIYAQIQDVELGPVSNAEALQGCGAFARILVGILIERGLTMAEIEQGRDDAISITHQHIEAGVITAEGTLNPEGVLCADGTMKFPKTKTQEDEEKKVVFADELLKVISSDGKYRYTLPKDTVQLERHIYLLMSGVCGAKKTMDEEPRTPSSKSIKEKIIRYGDAILIEMIAVYCGRYKCSSDEATERLIAAAKRFQEEEKQKGVVGGLE